MRCPDCSKDMSVVTVGTIPPIKLDVCAYCGGVWTDQSEANFFKASDLFTVGIPPKNVHPIKAPANRFCPKDNSPLVRFRGESVPEHVLIYHCDACGGNWFPHGQLQSFKHAQTTKLSFFKTWHIPLSSAYAILLPVFLILIITGGLIITVRSISTQQQLESQAKGLVGKPVVRDISPTEVFISFTTQKPTKASLTFWKSSTPNEKNTLTVSVQPRTVHTLRLTNMSSNTIYSYQISLETAQPITEIFTFTTLKN